MVPFPFDNSPCSFRLLQAPARALFLFHHAAAGVIVISYFQICVPRSWRCVRNSRNRAGRSPTTWRPVTYRVKYSSRSIFFSVPVPPRKISSGMYDPTANNIALPTAPDPGVGLRGYAYNRKSATQIHSVYFCFQVIVFESPAMIVVTRLFRLPDGITSNAFSYTGRLLTRCR